MIVTDQDHFLVDDSLFLLNKNGVKLRALVEKLKIIKTEVKVDVPNPPSRNTGDVYGYCNKKTNEHTKTTCPKNPKARRKKKATSIIDMSSMGELTFFLRLQVKQKEDGIFISQDKYVAEILKKFDFMSVKTASTLIETQKPLVNDEEVDNVDVHLSRSMIDSLMYLTAFRLDIMFAVCACFRFQVTPKTSHLHAVKRIFRKSTTGGCQFLGRRLISWQCMKQTIVATSTIEAEYVAAANCRGQVLWIPNQMLDYGFNFLNTKIYIDNESTICIVKNPVFHSKTKHIEIRHHFIRDAYEKKLIQVRKIHTDNNVADLLTKSFDVSRFNFLIDGIMDDMMTIWGSLCSMVCGLRVKLVANKLVLPEKVSAARQIPRDSLEGTNRSEGDKVQSSNDSPHLGGNTFERAEGGLNLQVLYNTCTFLSQQVLGLQTAKDAQAATIIQLKKRFKKMEKRFHGMDYMETEKAVNKGKTSSKTVVIKEKGSGKKGGSTVSTARPEVDTVRPEVDTAKSDVDAARQEVSVA
ncbi:hypothetical protein Tco_0161924 [Tanacetum coccineum]